MAATSTIDTTTTKVFCTEFASSLSELIEHYVGAPVDFQPTDANCALHACVITVGFSHKKFNGSVTLLVSHVECARALGAPDEDSWDDWLGELGNQLVGRFKNKLSAYGPLIDIGLPSYICGMELCCGTEHQIGNWQASCGDYGISGNINLNLFEPIELKKADEELIAEEGSLCFF